MRTRRRQINLEGMESKQEQRRDMERRGDGVKATRELRQQGKRQTMRRAVGGGG